MEKTDLFCLIYTYTEKNNCIGFEDSILHI